MLFIVLGYADRQSKKDPSALYVGHDKEAAMKVAYSEPKGIEVVRIVKNPGVFKKVDLGSIRRARKAGQEKIKEAEKAEKKTAKKAARKAAKKTAK